MCFGALVSALAHVSVAAQTPAGPPTPPLQPPAAAAPAAVDPAATTFTTDAGLLLVTVKPTMTAVYEEAIRTLQGLLAKDADPQRREAARGWRVFKAAEADAKGSAIYVHLMQPAVAGFDYRPSLLIDALAAGLPPALLTQYVESIAGAPARLGLSEFAHMAVAPVAPPEPAKPDPKKPGG